MACTFGAGCFASLHVHGLLAWWGVRGLFPGVCNVNTCQHTRPCGGGVIAVPVQPGKTHTATNRSPKGSPDPQRGEGKASIVRERAGVAVIPCYSVSAGDECCGRPNGGVKRTETGAGQLGEMEQVSPGSVRVRCDGESWKRWQRDTSLLGAARQVD